MIFTTADANRSLVPCTARQQLPTANPRRQRKRTDAAAPGLPTERPPVRPARWMILLNNPQTDAIRPSLHPGRPLPDDGRQPDPARRLDLVASPQPPGRLRNAPAN